MGTRQYFQKLVDTIRLRKFLYFAFIFSKIGNFLIDEVSAHGRLIEPPSRASMWRFGFDAPHDYNDHESYCGGFTRQWQRNNGKCGICGDAWDLKPPRPHETGGKFGNSIIVRQYHAGAIIPVEIELTANHRGYFEFRVCPMFNGDHEVTQDCLDKYLLYGENGNARYYPSEGNKIFKSYYKLPDKLKCRQCVFQWRYIAGNNWGDCGNQTGAVGCGPQEEFRACADISIGIDGFKVPSIVHSSKLPMPSPSSDIPSSTVPRDHWPEYHESNSLFNFIIPGVCVLIVLIFVVLFYIYYCHADRTKKWHMAKKYLISKQQLCRDTRNTTL